MTDIRRLRPATATRSRPTSEYYRIQWRIKSDTFGCGNPRSHIPKVCVMAFNFGYSLFLPSPVGTRVMLHVLYPSDYEPGRLCAIEYETRTKQSGSEI